MRSTAINSTLFSGGSQVVDHVAKSQTQLTAKIWQWIDEPKELKVLIAAASGDERYALELWYRD